MRHAPPNGVPGYSATLRPRKWLAPKVPATSTQSDANRGVRQVTTTVVSRNCCNAVPRGVWGGWHLRCQPPLSGERLWRLGDGPQHARELSALQQLAALAAA